MSQHSLPRPISSPLIQVGVPFLLFNGFLSVDLYVSFLFLCTVVLSCVSSLSALFFLPFFLLLSPQLLRQTLETYFSLSGSFSLIFLITPHLHVFLPFSPNPRCPL